MVLRGNLRPVRGALIAVVLVASGVVLHAVGADASGNRCERHREDASARARMVTGSGERVVVLGDSWSVGLGQPDLSVSWPARLPGRVHVSGFSGSGFSRDSSACGAVSFAARAAAIESGPGASAPDLVVVEGGLNDHDQPDAAIERGFHQLMAVLTRVPVVVVGPADAPSRTLGVPRVDRILSDLSSEYGVPYVATSDLSLPYLRDGLHLTTTGHREFGDAVAQRIAEVEPGKPSPRAP